LKFTSDKQKTMTLKTKLLAIALISFVGLASCKKNTDAVITTTPELRDSVYLYSQDIYLWSDNLPTVAVFKPLTYPTADSVMKKVRTYSPFVNGKYQDRWSFVINKKTWDDLVSGNSTDTGAEYGFVADGDLRVKLVYSQSSAGMQGVKRGWRVLKFNGVDATYANINQLNTELSKPSQSVLFQKPDGTQQTLTLTSVAYKSDYVMNPKVFTINGNNVGYFAFDSFLGANSGQDTRNELDKIFADFRSKNVTELVLDLRYNGGGYGTVSSYLGSLIAPASAVGKVFASAVHNNKYSKYNSTDYFKSLTNSLKLSRVSIITTKGTASASEELINGLKPIMTVKLIGNTTHGKPVGYYALPVMDSYVFPVALKNVNSVGFNDFFEGFTVDKFQTDDLTHDLGDPTEACLKTALNYIQTGVLQSVPSASRVSAELQFANDRIAKERLKVTVFEKPRGM
jgi:carboxyl-terminal processing protease